MDEIDLAQIREHEILTAALSRRRLRLSSPDGMCIWCRDMPVIPGTAFCSADCGDDFDKEQRLRTRAKCSQVAEGDE